MKAKTIRRGILLLIVVILFSFTINNFSVVNPQDFDYTHDKDSQQGFNFGNDEFTVNNFQYLCELNREYRSPAPGNTCWATSVNFQGLDHIMNTGDSATLNDYIDVTYNVDARVRFDDETETYYLDDRWENNYNFEFTNLDFLSLKIPVQKSLFELNEKHSINVIVDQQLVSSIDGGFVIYEQKGIIQNQERIYEYPATFKKGIKEYKIPIDTSELGDLNYKIYPYITIANKDLFDNTVKQFNGFVVSEIDNVDTSVKCQLDAECRDDFVCQKFSQGFKNIGICSKPDSDNLFSKVILKLNKTIITILILGILFLILLGYELYSTIKR